jgi:hypothetical protein
MLIMARSHLSRVATCRQTVDVFLAPPQPLWQPLAYVSSFYFLDGDRVGRLILFDSQPQAYRRSVYFV